MIVERNGKFMAVVKIGRAYGGAQTFDTRNEAQEWFNRQRAAIRGGIDPRAGKVRMSVLLKEWLELRGKRMAPGTYRADCDLLRVLSPTLRGMWVCAVRPEHLEHWYDRLRADGLSRSSIERHRASLSAFFTWCVKEHRIESNPVEASELPPEQDEMSEMHPFTEGELEQVYLDCQKYSTTLADVVLVAGWTGLRWGELRALQVRDVIDGPTPALRVSRSQSEGMKKSKTTKGRRTRLVPLADRALPVIAAHCKGKPGTALVFTGPRGGQLWAGAFLRALHWDEVGRGRRIHDLRHTAACLWLTRGVNLNTVKEWMGHQSIATTNLYLHHLGTVADQAGLALLNKPGVTLGQQSRKEEQRQKGQKPTPDKGSRLPESNWRPAHYE